MYELPGILMRLSLIDIFNSKFFAGQGPHQGQEVQIYGSFI